MARFENFEELVQYIKDNIDIVDVISEYVELKRVGSQWMGRCPFHADRTPSFSVSGEKGLFHCFGCGASGDVIKFIEDIENVSFLEALQILGAKLGIDVEEELRSMNKKPTFEKTSPSKTLKKAVAFAAQYYHRFLIGKKKNNIVLNYLYERGLENSDIEEWKIGFASPLSPFYQYLRDKGINLKPFIDAGILRKDGTDLMRNRIIIPIADRIGNFVSLGGRLWKGEGPKYLNGPETPIFKKGNILFGLHKAKKTIKEKRRVIFVEGYFDVIIMHKYGFSETVAPMGTALSDRSARELSSLVEKAYLMFDPDSAGIKATISSGFKLASLGTKVYVVFLPSGMDPDEFLIEYGEEKLGSTIKEGIPFEDFIASQITDNLSPSDPHKELVLARRLEEYKNYISYLTMPIWKIIATKIERHLAIPSAEITGRIERMISGKREIKTENTKHKGSRLSIIEKSIYNILLFSPILYTYLPDSMREDFTPETEKLNRLLRHIDEFFREHGENTDIETFHTYIRAHDDEIAKDIYKEASVYVEEKNGSRFICLVSRWLQEKYKILLQEHRHNKELFEKLLIKKRNVEQIFASPDLGCSKLIK